MGIVIEFNPDLALRNISEFQNGNRLIDECIPENMQAGEVYPFLKKSLRNYWLHGEIPLIETRGNENLSRPRASIQILESTHFLKDNEPLTKGKYKIIEVFKDDEVKFEGLWRVGYLKY